MLKYSWLLAWCRPRIGRTTRRLILDPLETRVVPDAAPLYPITVSEELVPGGVMLRTKIDVNDLPPTTPGESGSDQGGSPRGPSNLSGNGLQFNLIPASGMSATAIAGFQAAANLWSSILRDDIQVNINIDYRALGSGILGQASSTTEGLSYASVRTALISDSKSLSDASVVANLPAGPNLSLYTTQETTGNAQVDNNNTGNNSTLDVNTANSKALGLRTAGNTTVDASIAFSSSFTWDFDRSNGIASNAYDFIGVAAHEIGHALGFTSGVDFVDYCSEPNGSGAPLEMDPYRVVTPHDLNRFSTASESAGTNLDLQSGTATKYFSVNGGTTNLTTFSTGVENGDGRQASHWKDNLGIGIMDPTSANGEYADITDLDVQAFDVMGWDVAMDLGDAPDTGTGTANGNYQTLLSDNGPRHMLFKQGGTNINDQTGAPKVYLGSGVTSELVAAQNSNATGDTDNGVASIPTLARGTTQNVTVTSTGGNAILNYFVDFNRDGDFADTGESFNATLTSTSQVVSIVVPAGASPGTSFARFRISTAGGLMSVGPATDGEVEDYQVTISNTPPVAQNSSVTTNEDTAYTFASGNFLYTDAESDALTSITIVTRSLASGDTLRLSGVDVTDNQTITVANIPNLVYTPAANQNGSARSTFTFRANDAGNGVTSATMSINVTAVNDVPVAQNSGITTNEDTAHTFAVGNFLFTDIENDPLASITITSLSLASGDLLRLSGSNVTANQTITAANIPNLVYTPAANASGAARSTFNFRVNDAGTGTVAATMTISVNAVNDVPVAQASSVTTNEDVAHTFAVGNFLFTDVESDPLASITITSLTLASGDTLRLSGTDVVANQTITAANIPNLVYTPAANANGNARSTFQFRVNDAGSGVTAATMTINVTAVNDVPVAQNSSVTTNEDTAHTFAVGNFLYTDVENDALVSITLTSLALASGDLLRLSGTDVTANQTITPANIPNLVYTPAANTNGAARSTFTFRVNDAETGTVAATMTINVTAVNDVPVAQNSSVTTNEDTGYTFASGNFLYTDVENDALASITISSLSLASGDTLQISGTDVTANQTITAANIPNLVYTPAANANGAARSTFQFRVNDAGAGSVAATMTMNVTALNDVPVAQPSNITTNEDTAHTFAVANFLYTDVENDALASITISSLSLASGDTLRLSGTDVTANQTISAANIPNLVYTPAANANGNARSTFQFRVNDAGNGVTAATMTINVNAVNDVPVAQPSSVTTNEDTPHTFAVGNFLFTDAENDALASITLASVNLASGDTLRLSGADVGVNQTITAANIPNLVYTPAANANGNARSTFQFRVNDTGTGTVAATMTMNVTAVNDVPVAQNSSVTTNEDVAHTFAVANFLYTDVENDALASITITSLTLASGDTLRLSGTDVTANQTITAANIPNLVYTPAVNQNGSARSTFQFRVNDASTGTVAATMTVNVTAVNDVPVAQNNSVTTNEDTAYTFAVAQFLYTDVENDALTSITISSLSLASGDTLRLSGTDVTANQTITAANIPNLVYTPAANANGAARSTFQFRVNDAGNGVTAATMTINVNAVNDVPVAQPSSVTTNEDTPYTFAVANFLFTDAENDALASITLASVNLASGDTLRLSGTDVTANQTISAVNIPNLVYTPASNANATSRSLFQFRVNDAGLGTLAAIMTINVNAVNDLPVAQASSVTTNEDAPHSFTVANFLYADIENDPLASITIASLGLASGDTLQLSGTDVTVNQTITAANLPNLVYTPALNASGATRSNFSFRVNDAGNGITAATMTLNVTNVNDAPEAQANTVTTTEETPRSFALADFPFTDVEADSLASITISSLNLASGDTLRLSGTDVTVNQTISVGSLPNLVYTPALNGFGSARSTFGFTANDTSNGTTAATLTINVANTNDLPEAQASSVTTNEDTPHTFAASDFQFLDVDGDALTSVTFTSVSMASGDTLQLSGVPVVANQTITAANLANLVYTPAPNANGAGRSSLVFTVNDSQSGLVAATLTLDVTAINDVPTATPNSVTTNEDISYNFGSGDFPFTDIEGDSLVSITIASLGLASGDTLRLSGTDVAVNQTIVTANIPNLVYTPAADANGVGRSTFSFKVNDAGNGTNAATLTLNVTPVNDAPVAQASSVNTSEETPRSFAPGDFQFTDAEGDGLASITLTSLNLASGDTLRLNGTDVVVNQTISVVTLTNLVYTPATDANGAARSTFGFRVNDAATGTASAMMTLNVTEANDTPNLDTNYFPMLPALPAKQGLGSVIMGSPISRFVEHVTDIDGDPRGIAVTGYDTTNGTWQYSTDTGDTWTNLPTVSDGAAFLLADDGQTSLRFVPRAASKGVKAFTKGFASLNFKAWDQSDGATTTTLADTTTSNTAFSVSTERAWVAVGKAAPTVDVDGHPVLKVIPLPKTLTTPPKPSSTYVVKKFLGLLAKETDPTKVFGIAISGASGTGLSGSGEWQFNTGKGWQTLGAVSDTTALLLRPTDKVRFMKGATFNGHADLTYHTWDMTTGTFGTKVAATGIAFSSHTETAIANAAPILTPAQPSLGSVARGTTSTAFQVATILDTSATDVEQTTLGIVVSSAKGGTWEYSTDGITWVKVAKTVYLNASSYLRFTAAATAKVGSVASLSFKAWDQTLAAKTTTSKLKDMLTIAITA